MATTWTIGEVTITKVVEGPLLMKGHHVLPDATPDALAEIPWLRPHFLTEDGRFDMSIHALVVAAPSTTVLVDTCVGNDKPRSSPNWNMLQTAFLDELAAAGIDRHDVDVVVCTHLHIDHVGWNTMREGDEWVPTFPNARYLFARDEWQAWTDEADAIANDPDHHDSAALDVGAVMADSVTPILDAGLADLVDADHRVCDEVHLEPTPGHTAGHVSVHISSSGAEAVITGDMTHHPCQIAHPEWYCFVDHDRAQGIGTREDFYARYADTDTLIVGTHFAEPTAGHIVTDGDRYRFEAGA